MRWYVWGACEILYFDDWVCAFVLLVVRMRRPTAGAAGGLGDAKSCIQVEAFVEVLTNQYSWG